MDKFQNYVSATGKKYDFAMILPIRKVEEQPDGTLKVWGVVTAQKPDRDKEVCNYSKTVPFYKKTVEEMIKATSVPGMEQSIMPLREMHQLNAVGKGISIDFRDADREIYMGFEVVAAETITKVKKGVLPAFSQGGNYVDKWKSEEFAGCMEYVADPGEVSLVDRGSLPEALIDTMKGQSFALHKRDGSIELIKADLGSHGLGNLSAEDVQRIAKVLEESLRKGVRYLVPDGEHLPYTDESGKPNHRLMGAAWAALHGGYRGNKYEGPDKEKAIARLKEIYRQEGMETPTSGKALLSSLGLEGNALDTASETLDALLADLVGKQSREGEAMNAEQLKKCAAALGISEEDFLKLLADDTRLAKGSKGLAALGHHLKKAIGHHKAMVAQHEKMIDHHSKMGEMHKAHAAHHATMAEHLENAFKAHGACMDGEEADKVLKALIGATGDMVLIGKTADGVEVFRKADARQLKDGDKINFTEGAGGGSPDLTKSIQDAVKAAVEPLQKKIEELEKQPASNNGGTGGARLTLIGRDGKEIAKAENATAAMDPMPVG